MIESENLVKIYNRNVVVNSINLKIGKGEVFGFLGPNGAGKTTTINMLIGLIEPTSGKCYINNLEVSRNVKEVKKIIGHIPDGIGFYKNMTGKQNLKYFATFYDNKIKNFDKRAQELLDHVGLGNSNVVVGHYSRGMIQRLALAHALLNDPEVIFMDEPTNGLDQEGLLKFREIINEQSAEGKTIFFSTHHISEVEQLCNTIGIIKEGKLIIKGDKSEIKRILKNDNFTIYVETYDEIPKFFDPRIITASYQNHSAIITAREDIREDMSRVLVKNNIAVKELKIKEVELEDILFEKLYRGN